MNVSLSFFLSQMAEHPILLIAVILTLGVIFVNGWTDAPNAIATCVATRAMDVDYAIIMAAICNLAGILIMSLINTRVASTIKDMVNFSGDNHAAMVALSAALLAIVIWAVAAWYFGIPTSESHALIAGLSGAAIALQGGISGINFGEWVKVLYGLILSVVLGFGLGFAICKIVVFLFQNSDRKKSNEMFSVAQIFGAGAMAFMHGAQDGQKFIGVLLLCLFLTNGQSQANVDIPPWMIVLCALVMGVGTSIGGKKIIKSVGMDMVKLEKYQGFSADIAASISILLSTLLGIPVSTTHMKTTAIMGAGASRRLSSVNLDVVKEMALTWILTFPGCGIIGFIMAKVLLAVFS